MQRSCDEDETTFDEFGLHPKVLRGVYAYGLEKPSVVQGPVIRALLAGSSCLVHAPTGTGRTTAVLVAFLNELLQWDRAQEEARVFQLCWRFGGPASGLHVLIRDVVGLISKDVFDRRRRPRMM